MNNDPPLIEQMFSSRINSIFEDMFTTNDTDLTEREITKDSISAIACLQDEVLKSMTLIKLLKKGELIAVYKGDRTGPYDPDKFVIKTKNEMV